MNYQVQQHSTFNSSYHDLLSRIDANSDYWRENTSAVEKKRRGQHFTPYSMAAQLAVMATPSNHDNAVIADPGAGTGILSTSLASHLQSNDHTDNFSLYGFETDERLHDDLAQAWSFFTNQANTSSQFTIDEDFTCYAEQLMTTGTIDGKQKPHYITTNPPYNKLSSTSSLGTLLKAHGVPVSNLYAAFTVLAVQWLETDGHLLAVLPRSFCSGVYFKAFRRFLKDTISIEHITLYKSRSCFKNVLQENLLICARKRPQQQRVRITVANDPNSRPEYDLVLPAADILGDEHWALPRSIDDINLFIQNRRRPTTFNDSDYALSTGKVELHRVQGDTPTRIIYSSDFDNRGTWTWAEKRKPRYVNTLPKQCLSLPSAGGYIVLKRISSNDGESPKRIMPAWLSRKTVGSDTIALENHVQYIHRAGKALSDSEGQQLLSFFHSEEAQALMRTINGTTQINKSDIGALGIPSI